MSSMYKDTVMKLVSKSKPLLVREDVDMCILSYLETFEECSRCVGLRLIRETQFQNNGRGGILLEVLSSLPKTCMYVSSTIKKCSYCKKTKLCLEHYAEGVGDSQYYTGTKSVTLSMCSTCSWAHM